MASLQKKSDSWHLQFLYKNQRRTWVLGKVADDEALAIKGKTEERLLRIRQGFITVPVGMDIVDFLANDGKSPDSQPTPSKQTTFAELRDAYLKTHGNGTVEKNTFETIKLHISHISTTLGENFPVSSLTFADLQRHVDRRTTSKNRKGGFISAVTVKKEVSTFSGVWTWGKRMELVRGEFPASGLRYPKIDETPVFKTWDEIERAVAGGDSDDLWDCLYLRVAEITELLDYVREHAAYPFIYPMFCFAAHTGARRSEMLRAQVIDVDLVGKTVDLREKKRKAGTRTVRRVPLTPFLTAVLKEWLAVHPGGPHLFCIAGIVARSKKRSRTTGHKSEKTRPTSLKGRMATVRSRAEKPVAPLSLKESYDHFKRTLAESKWRVLKGWHVLRHSFISACATKGTDQRLLDDWCGHSTEEQRRRYRHLWPDEQQEKILKVFE